MRMRFRLNVPISSHSTVFIPVVKPDKILNPRSSGVPNLTNRVLTELIIGYNVAVCPGIGTYTYIV